MHIKVLKTDKRNPDFLRLTYALDDALTALYGDVQKQFARHNRVDHVIAAVVIYADGEPAACGAYKELSPDTMELKRIFVRDENRRQGLSKRIVSELEEMGREHGYRHIVLETGVKQFAAISLYTKAGYTEIPNYGPYAGEKNSICMQKNIS